jgi:hypothetical protein
MAVGLCCPSLEWDFFGVWFALYFIKNYSCLSLFQYLDDSITLYVAFNGTNYQVRRNSSASSRDWSDQFSFNACLEPNQTFNYPIYVFSAGGSPYWRQYISTNPSPPSGEYRTDYMFYVSSVPLVRSIACYVLESGSVPVIKSCISKTAQLTGWRSTGIVFYAMKTTRAGTPTKREFWCKGPLTLAISAAILGAIFVF